MPNDMAKTWALIEKAYNMQQFETVLDKRGLDIWNFSSFGVIFALWSIGAINIGMYDAIRADLELIYNCRRRKLEADINAKN